MLSDSQQGSLEARSQRRRGLSWDSQDRNSKFNRQIKIKLGRAEASSDQKTQQKGTQTT